MYVLVGNLDSLLTAACYLVHLPLFFLRLRRLVKFAERFLRRPLWRGVQNNLTAAFLNHRLFLLHPSQYLFALVFAGVEHGGVFTRFWFSLRLQLLLILRSLRVYVRLRLLFILLKDLLCRRVFRRRTTVDLQVNELSQS